MNLKTELNKLAIERGVDLIGFGSPERMSFAPVGQKPEDFLKGLKTIVSLGVSLPRSSIEYLPRSRRQFHNSFEMVNDKLKDISCEIAVFLEKKGYRAIPFTTQELGEKPEFSNNHAAVAAGLGEFSVSGIVLTPEFGPRVRFSTVLTEATIKPDSLMKKNLCLYPECRLCIDSCSPNAITSSSEFEGNNSVYGNLISELCRNYQSSLLKGLRCGLCIRACPVGSTMSLPDKKSLTQELKEFVKRIGADLIGIAPSERLNEAPEGHRPGDFLRNVKSIVSFGVLLPKANVGKLPATRREYQMSFLMASRKINRIGFELERFLEDKGYRSIAIGDGCDFVRKGSNRYEAQAYATGLVAEISNAHAAVAAGLGEFGISGLFLSRGFGPRVRLNTIITEAPLISDSLVHSKLCLFPECKKCIEICPPGAIIESNKFDRIKGSTKGLIKEKCNYYQNVVLNGYRCGLCVKACPVA